MLETLKDKIQLNKLRKRVKQIHRELDSKHHSGGFKSFDELQKAKTKAIWPYLTQIRLIKHLNAVKKAEKYNILIPKEPIIELGEKNSQQDYYYEYWPGENEEDPESYYLTEYGIKDIDKKARQELKERLDLYIPILTVIIGLVGTLIGLISVLKG